jgi:gamma-tubulin complex component 5
LYTHSIQVPFPLIYLFTPQTFLVRSSIFTFLLQIRRAKHSLEKLTLLSKLSANRPNGFSRDPVVTRTDDGGGGGEQKRFWALRRRLMWVVNELFNFFMVYVLELETEKFKEALEGTASLDEMIPLHEEQSVLS